MKFPPFLAIAATVSALGCASLHAQAQPQMTFTEGTGSTWDADWDGVSGRTYFLQYSLDLMSWGYSPTMRFGSGTHGIGLDTQNADKIFVRLKHTDAPGITSLAEAEAADFDNDGLTNYGEVFTYQTDPYNWDTDGDLLRDGWEVRYGLLPNNPDSDGNGTPDGLEDPDGDGANNIDEQNNEGDPNDPIDDGLAPLTVTGDGLQDEEITGNRTYDIPANGKSYLVVAYLHSDEYPEYTEQQSEFDDILRWDINPSNGAQIAGSASVNTLHDQWVLSEADGTSFYGYSPIAAKPLGVVHASTSGTVTVDVEVGVTNISDDYLPSTVMIKLEPVELNDTNGAGETDDVNIARWDMSEDIANENIAWIDAHVSAQNDAPRMPQLEFKSPKLPNGVTVEAKLNVHYDRGNGARINLNQPEDTVNIPAGGGFRTINGDVWKIHEDADWTNELNNNGFFGGDATLSFRYVQNGNVIGGTEEIHFRIGGENPDDAKCKAYIEGRPNAGPNGNLWFTYALARSESRAYNDIGQTTGTRYNQFLELPRHVRDVGRPLFGDDPSGPGGYGMIQVTGIATNNNANIPRKEYWNWQENILAGLLIIESKRVVAHADMATQRSQSGSTPLPAHTVRGVTFQEGTNRTMDDAQTIKAFNGASRSLFSNPDNGAVAGFILDAHSSGNYCYWRTHERVLDPSKPNENNPNNGHGIVNDVSPDAWALSRLNVPNFNYVDRVCEEVE